MINFEKYIKDALYELDFFIVPGLGGFIAKFTQAEIDESGQLRPPVKNFEFNSFLTIDDDKKFVNFIKNREHVSDGIIEEELKSFAFQIKSTLNRNSKVVIADHVELTNSGDEGMLIAEIDPAINFYERPDFQELTEQTSAEIPIENGTNDIAPLSYVQDQGDVENVKGSSEEESEENVAAPLVVADAYDTPELDQSDQLTEIEESYDEGYESNNREWLKYVFYIIPLLILFAGLYYVLVKRPFSQVNEDLGVEASEVVIPESDSLIDNGAVDSSALSTDSDTEITENDNSSVIYREGRISDKRKYPFEVAAGLFKSEENAERLYKRMRDAGFNAEMRLVNGMRRVYVGVNTIDEAEEMSNKIEAFTGLTSVYFDENGLSNK
ncbi:HU domain-containing protein [Jiulongibacter sp. NS-SX5]|uniref:HU domain-containing protein n=1 Tax=Jiulongibacter sp. NS-SX5 TaxID=3463854 RepID=UPI00405838F8